MAGVCVVLSGRVGCDKPCYSLDNSPKGNMTAMVTCASDGDNKENMENYNCNMARRQLSPGRIHGAPLRLVDANKLVFAPSPGKPKKDVIVVNQQQVEQDLDSLSTLELVDLVRDKMERLRVQAVPCFWV